MGQWCHSLTVQVDSGAAARAAAAGLPLWHERVPVPRDDPAARARARREALRPLHGPGGPLRAVLLEYADGTADLVLVARRTAFSRDDLRDVARSLSEGRGVVRPATSSSGSPAAAGTGPGPEWGLGDPAAGGRWGETVIPLRVPAPPDALLLAATALTVARHSGSDEPAVAVWSTGGLRVHRVDCGEGRRGADLLTACGNVAGRAARRDARLPAVGMVLGEDRPGERHRPFLTPPLPLVVHWRRSAGGTVCGTLAHRERDVAPEIARDFAAHLAHAARQLDAESDRTLREIDLVPAAEAARLLDLCAPPAAAVAGDTVHGLLAEVARARPDAVAVVYEETELTYAELDRRAARLARGLIGLGAAPGSPVAVALDRTAELVVAMLAILKAGCVFVPLDVRHPPQRLRAIVEHAGVAIAVARRGTLARAIRSVEPEELDELAGRTCQALPRAADAGSPAYVIYTSGSTGRPKGVVVPHGNVAALVSATREEFALGPRDTWTFFHSCAFDFSVWEIWGCLLTGGRLVVVPHWATRDTDLLYDLVNRRRVTVLSQTPSVFAQFVEADARLRADLALRLVVLGGEALDAGMLGPWFARHSPASCRVSNMFGITETTVHVTEQTVTPAEVAAGSRSVGRALPGWSLSVRDRDGRVLPAGAAGEICVGGAGVALGYLHQPELTAERFVADPSGPGRLYRSGDLGRIRPDGRLDHLGRIDDQVKIRGYRIELDEIRGVLAGHPDVAAAAVVVRYATPGDRDTARIDAYHVARSSSTAPASDLLRHARDVLPDYMVPATLTRLDALPLTANGKTDRAALPLPLAAPSRASDHREGSDPTAVRVLALWSRLLNTDVGIDDNFFVLGGNSLLAIRFLRELRDSGFPHVSMQDFYRHSAASAFIAFLRREGG